MPIVLVDRVLELHHSRSIVTIRRLDPSDSFFEGHFPLKPMLPGAFLLEAFAQTATILLEASLEFRRKAIPITMMDAKFRRPIVPGIDLRIEMRAQSMGTADALVKGFALQDGVRCASAMIGLATAPLEEFFGPAHLPFYRAYNLRLLDGAKLVGFAEDSYEELKNAAR